MPKYNDFDLDVQNSLNNNVSPTAIGTKYCPSMWCTEDGCTTDPVESHVICVA